MNSKNYSFGGKLLLTVLSLIIGCGLLSVVMFTCQNLPAKGLQCIQSLLLILLPAIAVAVCVSNQPFRYLGFEKKQNFATFLLVFLLAWVQIPFINGVAALNEAVVFPEFLSRLEQWFKTLESNAKTLTEQFLTVSTWHELAINLLVMGVLPAVGEELLFRGLLQRIFSEKMSKHAAIWVTAALFSALHMQFYGFVPRMLLGATFGYLLVWTKSLWMPIFAHFLNNSIVVVFFFLQKNDYIHFSIDDFGVGNFWWQAVASGALTLWLLKTLYNRKES